MAINSFKDDEQHVEAGKMQTLLRLFSYLLTYKKAIIGVLLIMAFCVFVSLVNPLIIESAIDDYISLGNFKGLLILLLVAVAMNVIMILFVKLHKSAFLDLSTKQRVGKRRNRNNAALFLFILS